MAELLDSVLLPVASPEDARASAKALATRNPGTVVAVHVVEKAGGAPDKAGVEQREEYAEDVFEAVRDAFDGADTTVETDLQFGTDVAETIFDAADDHDVTAIVITPREGSRWIRLLTGDVALSLVTETDRPVLVLPDIDENEDGGDGA